MLSGFICYIIKGICKFIFSILNIFFNLFFFSEFNRLRFNFFFNFFLNIKFIFYLLKIIINYMTFFISINFLLCIFITLNYTFYLINIVILNDTAMAVLSIFAEA